VAAIAVLLSAAKALLECDAYKLAAGAHTGFVEELLQRRLYRTFRDIEAPPDFLIAEALEHSLQYLILPFREGPI
jgi:hypothetical protein